MGDNLRLHHIGIIVRDIEKNIKVYSKLGYQLNKNIISDYSQNNRIAFMCSDFSTAIELIEPINELSSIYNFREGYHHICYEAEQGEDIVQLFKTMKIGKIFTKPIIAPALGNQEVVFACLQNGTFIEFIL